MTSARLMLLREACFSTLVGVQVGRLSRRVWSNEAWESALQLGAAPLYDACLDVVDACWQRGGTSERSSARHGRCSLQDTAYVRLTGFGRIVVW